VVICRVVSFLKRAISVLGGRVFMGKREGMELLSNRFPGRGQLSLILLVEW